MKLSSLNIFAIKLALFSSALLYMAVDLLWWHGPVWKAMYREGGALAGSPEPVAAVYGEEISAGQLARYEAEQDLLAGRTAPEAQRRASMLMDLVRASLLRLRTRYNDKNLPSFHDEAQEEVARLASRALDEEHFAAALASQGYTREQFTAKLETRLRSLALLERSIAPLVQVEEEEISRVFQQLQQEMRQPASREVRHIFLATLDRNPAEVRAAAEQLLARLQAGEDFATLAKAHSEDEHSAPQGGSLGVIADDSSFALPELPLFGEGAIAAGAPVLAQSRWGWHILLAGEISPARPLTVEEVRESIRTALLSTRREQAIRAYFEAGIREGFSKKRIQIHGY